MSFHATCQEIHIKDGHILVADAKNERGEHVRSELDLNHYIGNSDGKGTLFQDLSIWKRATGYDHVRY